MFGHPYNGGKIMGNHDNGLYDRNHAIILKMVGTDGYVWDGDNTWTWDDHVVGHFIPPMSTINWSTGDTPALTDEEFLLWNLEAFQGQGAITWGASLESPYGEGAGLLIKDWAMAQLTLMDAHLLANGDPGRTISATSASLSHKRSKVYPNPVIDQFVIELPNAQEATFTIINYSGQTVLSGEINGSSVSVDVSGLISGFYMVKVYDEHETYTKKIIKQ